MTREKSSELFGSADLGFTRSSAYSIIYFLGDTIGCKSFLAFLVALISSVLLLYNIATHCRSSEKIIGSRPSAPLRTEGSNI